MSGKAVLGVGYLHAVAYRDEKGKLHQRRVGRPWWLCWTGRDLVVAQEAGQASGRAALPRAIAAAHERFHGAEPSSAIALEAAPRPAGAKRLGLLVWLEYQVPRGVYSPARERAKLWRHRMGDEGHGQRDDRDARKPWLYGDAAGRLWIVRRPGNKYRVTDWVRG